MDAAYPLHPCKRGARFQTAARLPVSTLACHNARAACAALAARGESI